VFLSPFASERLLASDRIRTPNPDCPVCSVAQTRIIVDMARATLGDLVEDFLRLQLEYGEEIVINHGSDLLYDIEETDNLSMKLSELGILTHHCYIFCLLTFLQASRVTVFLLSLTRKWKIQE
jgi:ubiquitin-like 1-activating enzyme E1 B